jgi:hypothetical protein
MANRVVVDDGTGAGGHVLAMVAVGRAWKVVMSGHPFCLEGIEVGHRYVCVFWCGGFFRALVFEAASFCFIDFLFFRGYHKALLWPRMFLELQVCVDGG